MTGGLSKPPPVPNFSALVRRLHAAELLHLREVVAEQQAEIEELKRSLSWAESCADSWRDDALRAIDDAGALPGLTVDGRVVAVQRLT